VVKRVGVLQKVQRCLVERMQAENIDVSAFNVSDFVKKTNVESALILHDKYDKVIPIYQSKNGHANWRQVQFVEVESTGHCCILRTADGLDRIVAFIYTESA